MGFNSVGNYNGSFLGNSSAKPICGKSLSDFYKLSLQQAILNVSDTVAPGSAVSIKNTSHGSTAAGAKLNPNVLTIDEVATTTTTIGGFLLASETDVLLDGDEAPHPVEGQIVNVAVLGSGIELYLPCDAGVGGQVIGGTTLYWDVTNNQLTTTTTTTGNVPLSVTLLSPVVDGVKFTVDSSSSSSNVKYADTKCVRVKL